MADYCRTTPKVTQCVPEHHHGKHVACPPMQVCLPFGRVLTFDGHCLSVAGEPTVPDGEYGVIVVENGCIVDAKPNPVFEYTPPVSTEAAESCASTSGTITLQPDTCNMLSVDASGRYGAYIVTEAGDNITLSGCGTESSPLKISASFNEDTTTYLEAASATQVTVSGSGTANDPYLVGLASVMTAGTYDNFQIDAYGRVVKYNEPTASSITAIVASNGIEVTTQSGVAIISLAESGVASGTYQLGGYVVALDLAGRATSVTRDITVEEGSYDPHDWLITVNQFGSITGFTEVEREMRNHGIAHSTTLTFTTDCSAYIYVVWRGAMQVSTAGTSDGFVDGSSYMSCTVTDDTNMSTVTSPVCRIPTGTTVVGSPEMTEWRGHTGDILPAGTYTVTVTATGTLTGTNVLEAFTVTV